MAGLMETGERQKSEQEWPVGRFCGDGALAEESRRAVGRDIGASVESRPPRRYPPATGRIGVKDSRRGTRGQLVGGAIEVQVAGIFESGVVRFRARNQGQVSSSMCRVAPPKITD